MKIPWKLVFVAAAALSLLFLVGSLSGANRKLFNLALDQFRADQSRIVKEQADSLEWYEKERQRLENEKEGLKQEKVRVQAERNQIAAERDVLKGRVNELEKRRQVIVVSDDPDRILDDLRKLGFRSIRRR